MRQLRHPLMSPKSAFMKISAVSATDKLLLLGDFNARVVSQCALWPGIRGRNGTLLLSLCAEQLLNNQHNLQAVGKAQDIMATSTLKTLAPAGLCYSPAV